MQCFNLCNNTATQETNAAMERELTNLKYENERLLGENDRLDKVYPCKLRNLPYSKNLESMLTSYSFI